MADQTKTCVFPLSEKDKTGFIDLTREFIHFNEIGGYHPRRAYSDDELWDDAQAFVKSETGLALITKKGDQPIGYSLCNYSPETKEVWVQELFVTEGERENGAGACLFESILGWAKRMHCGDISTSVFAWNTGAKNFYKKQKFKEDGITLTKSVGDFTCGDNPKTF